MIVCSVRGHNPEAWLAKSGHVYCGRLVRVFSGPGVGRWPPSALGNPFTTRNSAKPLAEYEAWLRKHIDSGNVRAAFDALTADSVLGCWCASVPRPPAVIPECHCDVIAQLFAELKGGA